MSNKTTAEHINTLQTYVGYSVLLPDGFDKQSFKDGLIGAAGRLDKLEAENKLFRELLEEATGGVSYATSCLMEEGNTAVAAEEFDLLSRMEKALQKDKGDDNKPSQ